MKKQLFGLVFLVCTGMSYTQEYKLVWEENFDGTSLDSSIWNVEEKVGIWNTGQNAELQFYVTENIFVGDDGNGNNCLIIKAIEESYNGYDFTSGRINTNSKFSFQFGKLEARIKVPDLANGLWPAFWTEGFSKLGWPEKGEIDILEMGFKDAITAGNVNKWVASATHWEFNNNRADYSTHIIAADNMNEDYHLFTLEWTPSYIKTYLDETQLIYSFSLTGNDLEEYKEIPNFVLLNMAVGGILPGITNSAGITAPMPSEMYVDYVKLYQLDGQEDFTVGPHKLEGPFGIYTESEASLSMNSEFDSEIIVAGLDQYTSSPNEGYMSLAYDIQASQDFNLRINSLVPRNLSGYTNGAINFVIKTDYTEDFILTIEDYSGQTASLTIDGSKSYNPARDNSWSILSVPIADFSGTIDFTQIKTAFGLSASGSASATNLELDKIIWNEEFSGPVNTNFYGIFADHEDIETKMDFSTTGHIYVWNGFTGVSKPSYYGDGVLAFNANTGTWNGLGIQSDVPIDLSGFEDAYMNFAIKTTSNDEFTFGFQNKADQVWEKKIPAGTETAQFKRDGKYHVISIKLKDFSRINGAPAISDEVLKEVTIPFKLIGNINFSLDEIYLTKDGSRPGYSTIGINDSDLSINEIRIYPVPAENMLFSRGIERNAIISIFSLDGRFKEEVSVSADFELDISDYKTGMYLMKIKTGNEVLNRLFIKR